MNSESPLSLRTAVLTPAELAQMLKLSAPTVARRIADGTIRSVKIGHARRIPRAEVERLLMGAGIAA